MVSETKPRLIVVGAGGHAKVVLEALWAAGDFNVIGLIDPAPGTTAVMGVPVIGGDDKLPQLRRDGIGHAVIALGGNALRERVGRQLAALGYSLPAIIHPTAFIAPSARIADGAVIMARAVVGTDTSIGLLAIVNTAAAIDHDNDIGVSAHIAPACGLAGNVHVGSRTLVGVGSAVRPGTRIGADVVIGAGSAVVSHLPDNAIVGGAPARPLQIRVKG